MSFKMKAEILNLWCDALESGKYTQIQEKLIGEDGCGDTGYCCLGVLTQLAVDAGVVENCIAWPDDEQIPVYEVAKWAALANFSPIDYHNLRSIWGVIVKKPKRPIRGNEDNSEIVTTIYDVNDGLIGDYDFSEIAKIVRENFA